MLSGVARARVIADIQMRLGSARPLRFIGVNRSVMVVPICLSESLMTPRAQASPTEAADHRDSSLSTPPAGARFRVARSAGPKDRS
jgi:hypothetical protein